MATQSTHTHDDDIPELDIAKAKIVRRGPKHPLGSRLPLKVLREAVGKTQVEVAATTGMAQGDVSRLEQREDAKISTLRRYVEALGGELDLVVTLKTGHRLRIAL